MLPMAAGPGRAAHSPAAHRASGQMKPCGRREDGARESRPWSRAAGRSWRSDPHPAQQNVCDARPCLRRGGGGGRQTLGPGRPRAKACVTAVLRRHVPHDVERCSGTSRAAHLQLSCRTLPGDGGTSTTLLLGHRHGLSSVGCWCSSRRRTRSVPDRFTRRHLGILGLPSCPDEGAQQIILS